MEHQATPRYLSGTKKAGPLGPQKWGVEGGGAQNIRCFLGLSPRPNGFGGEAQTLW